MNDRNMNDMGDRQGSAAGRKSYLCDDLGGFFEDFTEAFEGRQVAVEERTPDGQRRVIADQQPLEALSYQVDNDSFDVRIVLGNNSGESFAHVVPDVRRIDYDAEDNGSAEALHIQSVSGLTDLRFR
jgi:hypothetical protein